MRHLTVPVAVSNTFTTRAQLETIVSLSTGTTHQLTLLFNLFFQSHLCHSSSDDGGKLLVGAANDVVLCRMKPRNAILTFGPSISIRVLFLGPLVGTVG